MSSQLEFQPYVQACEVSYISQAPDGKRVTVGPLNLELRRGEFISLLGPRGSGKSIVLKIIAGLIPATTGEVKVAGKEIESPVSESGFVFENPLLLNWRNVIKNVLLPAEMRGLDCRVSEDHARQLLAVMELSGLEDRNVHELSLDLAVRVSVCRALVHHPTLLLMDDPFRHVDLLSCRASSFKAALRPARPGSRTDRRRTRACG